MIDKFEMFIALAREQHFGRAAETCHVTQPTLSSAIRALEDAYGVSLVRRGTRFLGLTPEGERLLARARAIVAEERALRDDLAAQSAELDVTLRLGVIPTAITAVHELTGPLLTAHPRLNIDIRSMPSQDIAEGLANFQIDAGLSYSLNDAGHVPAAGWESLALYHEAWAVVMHEALAPAQVTWQDLTRWRLCLLSPDMQNRRILDRILAARGLEVAPVVVSSSLLGLLSHVMAGAGDATVLPLHPARLLNELPGLACRLLPQERDDGAPEVALLVPPKGRRSAAVAALVESARQRLLTQA